MGCIFCMFYDRKITKTDSTGENGFYKHVFIFSQHKKMQS